MDVPLIPSPRSVTVTSDRTVSLEGLRLPDGCPFDREVMEELWLEAAESTRRGEGKVLRFVEDGTLGEEAYVLVVGEDGGVEIRHGAPAGAYYGFVTLCGMVRDGGMRLRPCRVEDAPCFSVRGISDDLSRGQVSTLAHLKSVVRRLSMMKINLYMPYIEDVFAFESEPEIGKYSDPIEQWEWKELVEYAERHFVRVRPIFNTLGHWDKMGTLQRFRDLMIVPPEGTKHPTPTVLDPRHPEVRPLLMKLLEELIGVFGEGLIHVGGDEPIHLTRALGEEEATRLYVEHYRWLHDELARRGCRTVMYSDFFTPVWGDYAGDIDALAALPSDITMVYWNYRPERDYSAMHRLIDAGFPTWISPSTHNCGNIIPDVRMSYDNACKLRDTAGGKAEGLVMSNWGDTMDSLRELAWFGYAVGAEFAWAENVPQFEDFLEVFHRSFFGVDGVVARRSVFLYEGGKVFGDPEGHYPLWRELWKDVRKCPNAMMKRIAPSVGCRLRAARSLLADASPVRNVEAWRCLLHALDKMIFLADKLCVLPEGKYRTREEAMRTVTGITSLVDDCMCLLADARARWFAINRTSQWGYVEARYLDLIDSLRSAARYAANVVHFNTDERFLLE